MSSEPSANSRWNLFKFDFIRNIFIVSLLITGGLLLYSHLVVLPEFQQLSGRYAQAESNRVVRHLRPFIIDPATEEIKAELTPADRTKIRTLVQDFQIADFKLFSTDGDLLFTSSPIDRAHPRGYLTDVITYKQAVSRIAHQNDLTPNGHRVAKDGIETYIPLMQDNRCLGVVEIYHDLAPRKQMLTRALWLNTMTQGALAGGLLIVVIVTLLKTGHALRQRNQARTALKAAHHRLEKKIDERTTELVQVNIELEHEIEDRRNAEIALNEQLDLLQKLIDTIPYPIFYKNTAGVYLGCNTAFASAIGLAKDKIIGKTIYDLASKETAESYFRAEQALFDKPGHKIYETTVRYSDGRNRDIIYNLATFTDSNNDLLGLVGVMIDITDRKLAEQERVRLAKAIEQAADAIEITDADGRIQYVNPAFENMTGFARHEVVGRQPSIQKSGKQKPNFYAHMWSVLKNGGVWNGQLVNRRKDGTLYKEDVSISPVMDPKGRITNYVAVKHDVTEEMQRRKQLQQMHKMEAIGTLAGGIAHDFNNILSGIIGYIEISNQFAEPDSAVRPYLERMHQAANRARDLVGQILTFSRQEGEEQVPVRIDLIVKEALKLIRSSLPATIDIQTDFEAQGTVLADATQIHQVVMNLCTNAYHAMEDRGGRLNVALQAIGVTADMLTTYPELSVGHHLQLVVADTGQGMDTNTVSRIFEPYFTTKAKGKGTGLGLAIVHGIVKRHNGAVRVHSRPGEGTRFEIVLPQVATPAAAEKKTIHLPKGSERILIVDDESMLVELIKDMLEQLGYQTQGYTNPFEALDVYKADQQKFDLVITDMTMPGLTGDVLARQLLDLRTDLPIILCTGFSEKISPEKAREMGIQGYLLKPLTLMDLAATVRGALDGADASNPPFPPPAANSGPAENTIRP